MPEFNKAKLNRAIVVLFHHTLTMEPSSRIRISPENKRSPLRHSLRPFLSRPRPNTTLILPPRFH